MNNQSKIMGSKIIKIKLLLILILHSVSNFAQPDLMNNISKVLPSNQNASEASNTGFYSTSIPLYNFKGREMNLPITMSYVSNGIKVDQLASSIGLGWNLNVGGRIDRIVVGNPDFFIDHDLTITPPPVRCKSYDYLSDQTADLFSVSANGFSDIVSFSASSCVTCPHSITDPMVKVHTDFMRNNDGTFWVITDREGTEYYFGQNNIFENNRTVSDFSSLVTAPNGSLGIGSCYNILMEYKTSWLLTKIVSKNKLDTFEFIYRDFVWSDYVTNQGEGYMAIIYGIPQPHEINRSSYKVNQQSLTSIIHNGEKIIEFEYGPRSDMNFVGGSSDGNKLMSINFLEYKSRSNYFKKIGFDYTYFGTDPDPANFLRRRLKLDAVKFFGIDSGQNQILGDEYKFEYDHPENMPWVNSFAKDFLGLYNGKNQNIDLIPDSGSRNYNFAYSLTGTLTKITYPNKGYTVLDYEQNAKNGGYGNTIISGGTQTIITEVELANLSDNGHCSELLPEYRDIHNDMESIDLFNFPYTPYTYMEPRTMTHATTMVLDLTSEITETLCYIETHGVNAVYSIHKLPNCNLPTVTSPDCEDNNTSTPFDGCMASTTNLVCNGIINSHPFLRSGLTYSGNPEVVNAPMNLEPAKYQITLWTSYYYFSENPNQSSRVRIYKKISETVPISDQIHSLDVTSGTVDGFRIKSVTNYTKNNEFASKKIYRYDNGILDDFNSTYNATGIYGYSYSEFYAFSGEVIFKCSKGYSNGSEIIHYGKVFEIDVDNNNNNNGYTVYHFVNSANKRYPFHTSFDYKKCTTNFTGGINKFILNEKTIYNKQDQVVRKDEFTYGLTAFCTSNDEITLECDNNEDFPYVKRTKATDYLSQVNNIEYVVDAAVHYQDGPEVGEYPYRISQKTTNGEVENYKYGDPYTPLENMLLEVDSEIKGTTKYIYTSYNHGTTSAPIMRNLVTEVQHAKHGYTPEPISQFIYDNNGNKVQTTMTSANGTPLSYESYIYGYNDRFIVAKLSGVTYLEVEQLGARLSNIKLLSDNPVSEANENALIAELNLLRSDFQKAPITTYTYNPVYGVTSTTDAKGYTIFSEYDAFGRLKLTKEKHKSGTGFNIISENQYHTISNP